MSAEAATVEVNGVNNDAPMDITKSLFGHEPEAKNDESTEASAGAGAGFPEDEADASAGDGTEIQGDSDGSETDGEIWTLGDVDYTTDDVTEALQHREVFTRFNESFAPLVANIRSYGETAQQLEILATTETSKVIAELEAALKSGRLPATDYQSTHQQLIQAKQRLNVLNTAAAQEKQQREQALKQAQIQNVRNTATNLYRSGWSKAELTEVDNFVSGLFKPDQIMDAISPEFMALARDAMAHRKAQAEAETKLRAAGKKAVRVQNKKPVARVEKKTDVGTDDWITKNIWGAK